MKSTHQNRLAQETSPYLLQHAHNPVDWFPWGPEALQRAKQEDKPILLSIGYAACHWCHVMERESFENAHIAKIMNEHFVCIKVDREERPDIDEIYMAATVALSGSGGWPMTVLLTPDQKPFFAGTYFPPTDRYGRPGFPTLLARMAELWDRDRETLLSQAEELTAHVQAQGKVSRPTSVSDSAIDATVQGLAKSFDARWGGFGPAPKFPASAALLLLMRHHQRSGDERELQMVVTTLDAMKNGGICDQVGGGFARYSTDERWLAPHFEKMLYDNAQLAKAYLAAFQVTGDAEYRRVVEETLDYVIREMQSETGGYFSATDADSEGVEGKFFVWSPDELAEVLGADDADHFCAYYDVTAGGNWEGESILNTPRPLAEVATELGQEPESLRARLSQMKAKVYAARQKRVPPLLDDKILTAWNGLMIGAMAEGYRVLGHVRYLESARRAAAFVLDKLVRDDGGLFRTARGGRAHLDAVLEDYAYLCEALTDLYEAGGDPTHLRAAERFAERALSDFGDPDSGAFFFTAKNHEPLIARSREGHDGALPNPGAVFASALLRLGRQLDRSAWLERAERFVTTYGREIERMPRAFCTALCVADSLLTPAIELVFAGVDAAQPSEITSAVAKVFVPNRVVGFADAHADAGARALIRDKKPVAGKPALYICKDFTCLAPVTSAKSVGEALSAHAASLANARKGSVGLTTLSGHATEAGTARFAQRHARHGAAAYGVLGGTELRVARFGFGGYRIDDRADEHRDALRHAIESGVNLVDTSTNYTDGHSERLVGEVLRDLVAADKVARDEVVVVSKLGYVQGDNLRLAEAREAAGTPFPEMVKVGRGIWHCLHPEWLEDQLDRSRERLGVACLDVCLLHNPEYFLSEAASRKVPLHEARDEFYRRLTATFAWFEGAVERGQIRAYGVSSNTCVVGTDEREATDLARMLAAATAVAPSGHHFRVLQLPYNLLEPGAALTANSGEPPVPVLEYARAHGVAVLVNRPLNAIVAEGLVRLAEPEDLESGLPLEASVAKLEALEREFRTNIAPSLQTGKGAPPPQALLDWTTQLRRLPLASLTLAQWNDVESQVVAPRTAQVLSALDRGMQGATAETWRDLRERYVEALSRVLHAFRARAVARSRSDARALAAKLDRALPQERRSASLSQKALHVIASTPGVNCVLVGMRRNAWVDDVLGALSWPLLPSAVDCLTAVAAK
jgi:hypothetical protein